MKKGYFITIEGGEGSGKSTLANSLKTSLEGNGFEVLITREPGGIEVSEKIRSVIMDHDITAKTEALLFAAARVEHLEKKVIPAINKGIIVISDRYIDSSVVYQGYARDLGVDTIRDLNLWATDHFLPKLTLFLNIDPQTGINRIINNDRQTNRFDHETNEFHQKLSKGYEVVMKDLNNVLELDASLTREELTNISTKKILELINE
ncbi:MAG: dTMP kinase [Mycoplasmatales bacterium]